MTTPTDRLDCLLTTIDLPPLAVDLGTYKRLQALADRIAVEDPTLDVNADMDSVVYAAVCSGLRDSEERAGVRFDEITGERIA